MKTQGSLTTTNQGEQRGMMSPFDMLQSQIDRIFDDFTSGFRLADPLMGFGTASALNPMMDIHDTDKQIVISAELPGVKEEDVDISVADRVLTISGEKKAEMERTDGDRYRSERSYGRFSRSLTLPFMVDAEKVEAKFEHGVLKLTIMKPDEVMQQTKKIPIRH